MTLVLPSSDPVKALVIPLSIEGRDHLEPKRKTFGHTSPPPGEVFARTFGGIGCWPCVMYVDIGTEHPHSDKQWILCKIIVSPSSFPSRSRSSSELSSERGPKKSPVHKSNSNFPCLASMALTLVNSDENEPKAEPTVRLVVNKQKKVPGYVKRHTF